MTERLNQIVGDTFNIDPETVDEDSSPDTIAEWTSFNHLTLMAAVEEGFGITLSMEEMTAVHNVADLRRIVASHAA